MSDNLYRERAHIIAALATQWPAVLSYADPQEPDWAVIFIYSPAGQLSWHIAPDDIELFPHVPIVSSEDRTAAWDGHSTEEKFRRIQLLCRLSEIPPAIQLRSRRSLRGQL